MRLIAEAILERPLGIRFAEIDIDRFRIASLHERVQMHATTLRPKSPVGEVGLGPKGVATS